jgi:predicted membrane GTPase involved in stress response
VAKDPLLSSSLRDIAIIAHVDHGKTTLAEAVLERLCKKVLLANKHKKASMGAVEES